MEAKLKVITIGDYKDSILENYFKIYSNPFKIGLLEII